MEDDRLGHLHDGRDEIVRERSCQEAAVRRVSVFLIQRSAERMGKKRLAYEIQKLREGHYVCMKFKGAAACADEIIRQMRLHENVLRALVVRV